MSARGIPRQRIGDHPIPIENFSEDGSRIIRDESRRTTPPMHMHGRGGDGLNGVDAISRE